LPGVLLVKGSAGLGNRILSLLSAILYAKLSGRRVAVDWSDSLYARNNENSFPLLFSKPVSAPMDREPVSVAPPLWRDCVNTPAEHFLMTMARRRERSTLSADLSRLDHPEDVLVFWAQEERVHQMRRHFHGDFQALARKTDDEILRDLIRSELALHPEIAARVREFKQSRWGEEVVGVHMRYSDRRGRIQKTFRHVDRIVARHPRASVFLATDNEDLLRHVRDRYGAGRLIATEKWFPVPGQPIHRTAQGPDALQKAQDALLEMYLLGSCRWLVSDHRSSFAYVAALLSNSPPDGILNVDPGAFLPRWLGQFYGIQRDLLLDDLRYLRRRFGLRS
jgi:hypothetical protein